MRIASKLELALMHAHHLNIRLLICRFSFSLCVSCMITIGSCSEWYWLRGELINEDRIVVRIWVLIFSRFTCYHLDCSCVLIFLLVIGKNLLVSIWLYVVPFRPIDQLRISYNCCEWCRLVSFFLCEWFFILALCQMSCCRDQFPQIRFPTFPIGCF